MAGMYGVYHGEKGLRKISKNIHSLTATLEEGLTQLGYQQLNKTYFDTLHIFIGNVSMDNIRTFSEDLKMNFNYIDEKTQTSTAAQSFLVYIYLFIVHPTAGRGPRRPLKP